MKRRNLLRWGCAHCALLMPSLAAAQGTDWQPPERFVKPSLDSEEGGYWSLMDREEGKLRRSPFQIRDPSLKSYIQDIVCRLTATHCPDIRVHVIRMPYFNASMAPNGMMQVWSGLLLRVENEAQLAAVLAHEIAHYLQRHTLERMRDLKARSAAGVWLAPFGLLGLVGQVALLAGGLGFSRDQEREADRIGLTMMRTAGYDPREAAKIWGNLRAEVAANPTSDAEKSSPMFATHPDTAERETVLAAMTQGADGQIGRERYAERIRALRFQLLDDELRRGRPSESLVLFNRMLTSEPQSSDVLFFRGECYRARGQQGDKDAAYADFEAAISFGQEPARLHRSRGEMWKASGQKEKALEAFGRYLELAPDAPDAGMVKEYLRGESR